MAEKTKVGIQKVEFIGEVGDLMQVNLKLNIGAISSSQNIGMLEELVNKIQAIELGE